MSTNDFDILIIGGGASGMMTAIQASTRFPVARICIIEKNKNLGQKLSITGGGRCNITNATFDLQTLLTQYGEAEKYLYSSFSQFSVEDTIQFFEKNNVPLITQDRNRVFPKSEKATDVTLALSKLCIHKNITIILNTYIRKINHNDSKIDFVETQKGERYTARSYILATGGLSHPETGSTGDGFKWLTELGHTIKEPTPTLVPWNVSDEWIHQNSGTAFEDVKITVNVYNKKYFSCIGRVLCTHTGLSGPLILNHSSNLQDALLSGTIDAYLDMYPYFNHKELDQHVLSICNAHLNKKIKNILSEITRLNSFESLYKSHIPSIDFEAQVNTLTKDTRNKIIHLLKKLPLNIKGLQGYAKSIVTDGGISLSEIDMRTMKSKKITNLSITGDLLNIKRPSGGYSLQLCWTTGYVAGSHCLDPNSK